MQFYYNNSLKDMSIIPLTIVIFIYSCNFVVYGKVTEEIKQQCFEENRIITPPIMNTTTTTTVIKKVTPVDNLCYTRCLFIKGGYLNATNGVINVKQMRDDRIITANGDTERLNRIYNCIENLTRILKCEQTTGLIQCFSN